MKGTKTLKSELFFSVGLATLAIESIGGEEGEKLARQVDEMAWGYAQQYCDRKSYTKLIKSLCGDLANILDPLLDKQSGRFNAQKMILALFEGITQLNEEGYYFPEFYEELFEPFLKIENEQTQRVEYRDGQLIATHQTVEDWEAVRQSAKKCAGKIIENLRKLDLFKIKN